MILNYLKLAFRLLIRNPFFTAINALGLSVGFAVFFVIWQYSTNELKSDEFIKDHERVVRLNWHFSDANLVFGTSDAGFEKILCESYPELSDYVRLCPQASFRQWFTGDHDKEIYFSRELTHGEKRSFVEQNLAYADVNLFNFFSLPLSKGNPSTVLREPSSVVLSEKLAKKYFGDEDPVGMILIMNDKISLTVTGIFRDLPDNTHLNFEAVISLARIEKNIARIDFSKEAFFKLYIKLPRHADRAAILSRIDEKEKTLLDAQFARWNWEVERTPIFQELHNIVFQTIRQDTFKVKSRELLNIFLWVAIIVLLLGWINYVNLSLSAHKRRMKEINARHALGARKFQFITQFIVEGAVVNGISFLIAVTFIQILKNPLEQYLQFSITSLTELNYQSWLLVFFILIIGLLFSGFYPAMVAINRLSRTFLTSQKLSSSENYVTRSLTVTQFIIAVTLIVWIFTVYRQMNFIATSEIGVDKENVIVVDLPFNSSPSRHTHIEVFGREVLRLNGVRDYTVSSSVAGDRDPNGIGFQRSKGQPFVGVATNGGIDHRFIPFYSIKLLAGRNFLPDNPADQQSVIVSRRALQLLDIPFDQALGKRILVELGAWTHNMVPATIIGVIEDYKHQPLLNGFQGYWSNDVGIGLTYGANVDRENTPKKVSVRVNTKDFDQTMASMKELFDRTFQGHIFNWTFLDDNINRHYVNEIKTRNQIFFFTIVAIGIACLGLLGMVSNKAIEKTKEIGIRKVMGAEIRHIAGILLNTTIKQAVISAALGIPIAWFLTERYLEKFSEHVTLQWWHFALPVGLFLVILLFTIISVVWRAAHSNPVDSLRYE